MFTRNRMCALARPSLGLTPANMLDRMLDPAVRLATSTPGADPGGDYAWAVFARAEACTPGAQAALQAKALKLVGGADTKPFVPGKGQVEGVFLADKADIMLGYCSGSASVMHEVPGLISVPLPPDLTIGPAYGMVVLTDNPLADRFALFVMSERGQAILARYGFTPVALPDASADRQSGRPEAPAYQKRRPTRTAYQSGRSMMKLSARNQIKGKVVAVQKGQTTGHVRIDIGSGVIVTSSITNEAIDELGACTSATRRSR